jgi:hypothetical protein
MYLGHPTTTPTEMWFPIENAPLNTRAWVLQERVLSRRIVHFKSDMVYMECDERFCSAAGTTVLRTMLPRFRRRYLDATGLDPWKQSAKEDLWTVFMKVHSVWCDLVLKYSRCSLTRAADKLLAIQGLARALQGPTGLITHDGIWFGKESFIPLQLLWRSEGKSLRKIPLTRAPSWS